MPLLPLPEQGSKFKSSSQNLISGRDAKIEAIKAETRRLSLGASYYCRPGVALFTPDLIWGLPPAPRGLAQGLALCSKDGHVVEEARTGSGTKGQSSHPLSPSSARPVLIKKGAAAL